MDNKTRLRLSVFQANTRLYTCLSIVSVFQANTRLYIDCISFTDFLGCLRSAFSLKISLVLISSGAIANHDVIITIRD